MFSHRILTLLGLSAVLVTAVHAETYEIDPDHCDIAFSIKHLGINTVRGNFGEVKGSLAYDKASPLALQAQATIQARSINTGIKKRDDHLRSEDFFEVAKYPEIVFVSKGLEQQGDDLILNGTLVMKGVSKDISLRCEISGPVDSPVEPGVSVIGLSAKGRLSRDDFGVIPKSEMIDKLISHDVKLDVNFEAKKK